MKAKVSLFLYIGFLLSFPFSVSVSQILFLASFASFLPFFFQNRRRFRVFLHPIFLSLLGYYLILAILGIYQNHVAITTLGKKLLVGEASDFWIAFAIPHSILLSRTKTNRMLLNRFWKLAALLILLLGTVSVFTEFRLNLIPKYGSTIPEGVRPQHFAGTFFGINTYLPIGANNTHLTFGMLLSLSISILFRNWKLSNSRLEKRILEVCFLLSAFVLLWNQSRSIWIAILLLVFFSKEFQNFFERFWRNTDLDTAKTQNVSKKIYQIGIVILLLSTLGFVFYKSFSQNPLLERAISSLTKTKTTENQRYFIFRETISMIKNHPFLGVGIGNFPNAHWEYSEKEISKNQDLFYEWVITPRGHAHNDFLHVWSIGGIGALFSYLLFWFLVLHYRQTRVEQTSHKIVWILFLASFSQCFFQDDEVILPYFALLGFSVSRAKFQLSFRNTCLFMVGFLLLLAYPKFSTTKPIEEAFQRRAICGNAPCENFLQERILSELKKEIVSSEAVKSLVSIQAPNSVPDEFRIEGCLTHEFKKEIIPREKPFRISFLFPVTSLGKEYSYPKEIEISFVDRDSFDQDKLYKAHSIRTLKTEILFPTPNKTTLEQSFPDEIHPNTNVFNDTIRFRDFGIRYQFPEGQQRIFPLISVQKNCE